MIVPELVNRNRSEYFHNNIHPLSTMMPQATLRLPMCGQLVHTLTRPEIGYARYNIHVCGIVVAVLEHAWNTDTPLDPRTSEECVLICDRNSNGETPMERNPLRHGWKLMGIEAEPRTFIYMGREYHETRLFYLAAHECGATFKWWFK